MARRSGFFALAFGSGFAVLTIEIAGARLISPVFGLSVVPWTAVIGTILAALAAGSHLGGRLADAGKVPLSRVLVVASLTGALPVIGSGFPWIAREMFGFIPGAVVSALVLFAPPVLCLGAVVPYLVQADTDDLGSVGRRAGDISASATTGSIIGSFVTGFVLLPLMPLPTLLGITAGALMLMAVASTRILGGQTHSGQAAAAVIGLPILGVLASGLPPDALHAEQTLHTAVSVTERPWADGRIVRELWQNGGSSSAEYVESGAPAHVYATMSLEMLMTRLDRVDRALILGGAALSLPVALQEARSGQDTGSGMEIDVVEIDDAVTQLAREYFAFGERDRPGIRVYHDDARVFLRSGDDRYDVVYLDVFDHLLTVPWTMVTEEALSEMRARTAADGVFMANVLSPLEGDGTAFLARFRTTLEGVFPASRIYMTDPDTDPGATQNLIVMGAETETAFAELDGSWILARVPASGRALTDDWAPVESLQARVFMGGLRWR